MNLISNSAKFTQSGKVKLVVSAHNCLPDDHAILSPVIHFDEMDSIGTSYLDSQSEFQEEIPGVNYDSLRIEVIDTGCGMDKSHIGKLFERYRSLENRNSLNVGSSQTQNAQREDYSHASSQRLKTGLSMWVTKNLVEAMGGQIRIYSGKEKGTSVVLTIKLQKMYNTLEKSLNVGLFETKVGLNLRAMVVEDIPFNATINRDYLNKCRAQVIGIAQNGVEAVSMFQKEVQANRRVDLICMDIEMPELDGKQAAVKIREIERQRGLDPTIIIFMSGNCTNQEFLECLNPEGQIRGQFFMRKPVNFEEFAQTYSKIRQIKKIADADAEDSAIMQNSVL